MSKPEMALNGDRKDCNVHIQYETHPACFQVPAPAVVQETHNKRSQEITDQDGQISHLYI